MTPSLKVRLPWLFTTICFLASFLPPSLSCTVATEEALEAKRSSMRTLETELEKIKSEESKAERMLAEESKAVEKYLSKRSMLMQKQDDCLRKIRDLGSLPAGLEK